MGPTSPTSLARYPMCAYACHYIVIVFNQISIRRTLPWCVCLLEALPLVIRERQPNMQTAWLPQAKSSRMMIVTRTEAKAQGRDEYADAMLTGRSGALRYVPFGRANSKLASNLSISNNKPTNLTRFDTHIANPRTHFDVRCPPHSSSPG